MQDELKKKIEKLNEIEQKKKEIDLKIECVNEALNATDREKENIMANIQIAEREIQVKNNHENRF